MNYRRQVSPMSSLPTWAVWGVVVPLVLLSPVIALMLAIAGEGLICAMFDAGAPAGAALAALAGMLRQTVAIGGRSRHTVRGNTGPRQRVRQQGAPDCQEIVNFAEHRRR